MMNRFSQVFPGALALVALGLTFAASAPVADWTIAGPFGGTATALAIDGNHPNVLLAGARNSLLFESDDSATHWQPLNLPKRTLGEVTSILIDPQNSDHFLVGMIAGFNPGLFDSHNHGKDWTAVKELRDVGVRALAFAPSKPSRFVAGTLQGVMLSDDAGQTWTRISDPQNPEMVGITAVAFDTKNPDIIYAGTPHLPWRTSDGGKTWDSIHTGMIDDSDVFSIYVDPAAPNDVFASACSGIYSTTDRGDVWHKLLGIPNTSRRTHVVREDPALPGTIYAGTTLGLFKSTNGGSSWRTLNDTQVNSLAFDPSQTRTMYLALEYEGVGKSDNSGESIRLVNDGFADRNVSSVTTSGSRLYAVEGATGDLFVSADRGSSWSSEPLARTLEGVRLRTITGIPSDPHILFAGSPHQIYKTIDGGKTWKPVALRVMDNPNPPASAAQPAQANRTTRTRPAARGPTRTVRPRIASHLVYPADVSGLYAIKNGAKDIVFAASDIGLLVSTDLGEYWSVANLPGSTGVDTLYLTAVPDGRIMARATGGLYLSKDFGEHWTAVPFPLPPSDINGIAVPPSDASPLLAATRVGLYRSTDEGQTWLKGPHGLPSATVSAALYGNSDGTLAYAIEYGQLYQSTDGGANWSVTPTRYPSLQVRQLWVANGDFSRLYGITIDLGILFRE